MHEYDFFLGFEDNVGGARQVLGMQSVSKASLPYDATNLHFRLRILALDF